MWILMAGNKASRNNSVTGEGCTSPQSDGPTTEPVGGNYVRMMAHDTDNPLQLPLYSIKQLYSTEDQKANREFNLYYI